MVCRQFDLQYFVGIGDKSCLLEQEILPPGLLASRAAERDQRVDERDGGALALEQLGERQDLRAGPAAVPFPRWWAGRRTANDTGPSHKSG